MHISTIEIITSLSRWLNKSYIWIGLERTSFVDIRLSVSYKLGKFSVRTMYQGKNTDKSRLTPKSEYNFFCGIEGVIESSGSSFKDGIPILDSVYVI